MKSAQAVVKATKRKARGRRNKRRFRRRSRLKVPALRFSPYAWAKLLYLRDRDDSEVGGFGITDHDDLLLVKDVQLVRQYCTSVSVQFDDTAVADFFDHQVDAGRQPAEFARLWLHTHPASCAQPSSTDEETFGRCFGGADWSVMFVLAQGGQTYARLRFGAGPGGSWEIPVEVDFRPPCPATDQTAWEQEYVETVQIIDDPLGCQIEDEFSASDLGLVEAGTSGFQDVWDGSLTEDLMFPSRKEDP
jgi:hypothetical protein